MARPTAAHKQAREAAERARTTRDTRADGPPETPALSMVATSYDPLLTIEEVSDWLGIPRGTLYQWRTRKLGPRAIKVGGALRYRRAEVESYLDQHTDPRTA
jgi:excisionase family DNA binding protein